VTRRLDRPAVDRLLGDVDRLLDLGRPAVAGLLLDAIAANEPDTARVAERLARTALALGQPLRAIASLNAAMATGTMPAALFLWRARAWLAAGDSHLACEDAGMAAARAPADAAAAGLFATLLIETGQAARAACVLASAIAAGAGGPALHVALTIALLTLGEPEAARRAVLRGLAAEPRSLELRRLQATCDAAQLRAA